MEQKEISSYEYFQRKNINKLRRYNMEEGIIKNIIKLRYFKSSITDKFYGDFYVETKEGSYYVFINDSEISILSHLVDRDIDECILKPTQKFKEEFLTKIENI